MYGVFSWSWIREKQRFTKSFPEKSQSMWFLDMVVVEYRFSSVSSFETSKKYTTFYESRPPFVFSVMGARLWRRIRQISLWYTMIFSFIMRNFQTWFTVLLKVVIIRKTRKRLLFTIDLLFDGSLMFRSDIFWDVLLFFKIYFSRVIIFSWLSLEKDNLLLFLRLWSLN